MPLRHPIADLARAKPIYPRYRLDPSRFRVGAERDLTVEITDPEGQMWTLLSLLDGCRDLPAVVKEMQTLYPQLSATDIEQGVIRLDAEGLLDDPSPTAFDTDPRLQRYLGNVNYFSRFVTGHTPRGSFQDLLLQTRVVLLGLGGGGSTVLQLLGAIGVGHIRAVDKDAVEVTNLNRQLLYATKDVGRTKADAARDALERQNPFIPSEFLTAELSSVADVEEVIEGADLVISLVDEPPLVIQRIVNRACVRRGVPCVYGLSQVSRGRVLSVVPGQGACIDCLHLYYTDIDPDYLIQYDTLRRSGFHSPPLAYAPAVMRLCAELVDEAVRIVTGYLPLRSLATQLELDYITGATSTLLSWPRDEQRCPSCGSGREQSLAASLGISAMSESSDGD